jgi:uncharacterized protein (DUF849 family)
MDNGKVIITCAITGGMTVPTQSEAIPVTVDEIIEAGVQAAEAGAAVLHIHVREEATGRPVQDPELFGRVLSGLSQRTDAVLQTTTGGGQGMTVEERGAIVPRFKPEMATLNAGSMNFGLYPIAARNLPFQDWEREYLESTRDYVFRNTFAGITYLAGLMRDAGTRPEIEIYDLGQLYNLRQLVNDGVVEPPFSLQFVLGVLGGSSSEPDHLIYLLRTAERLFGAGSFTWSAAGVGYPAEFELAALGLMLGGNIRVGLEDNLRVRRTARAKTNAELVGKAVQLAGLFDKTPASPAEAREYLRLKGADRVAF